MVTEVAADQQVSGEEPQDEPIIAAVESDAESCGSDEIPLARASFQPTGAGPSNDGDKHDKDSDSDAESYGSDKVQLAALKPTDVDLDMPCSKTIPVPVKDNFQKLNASDLENSPAIITQEHLDMLSEIHAAICKKTEIPKPGPVATDLETDITQKQIDIIKGSRSVADFAEAGFLKEEYDAYYRVIRCDTCCGQSEYNAEAYKTPGFFKYELQYGRSFNSVDILPSPSGP